MKLEDVLAEIFIDVLRLDKDVDVKTLKYRSTEKWDSLAHMELVTALEERFDIMLDNVDVLRISSFQAAVDIIGTKYGVAVEA
ncbi:MAG: acyl carrier protein [Telmatospirillum sp.]|nr:acyl carrier protein [Telmatospirillum sp.]